MIKVNLNSFNNSWYKPGSNFISGITWYFINALFFKSSFPISSFKKFLLKLFGCQIEKGVVIKPHVNIKYPWRLKIGKNVWIGENVWIDNLANISIGDNCCISQGAMLLTGNHDYKKSSFDLMIGEITLEEGVWIGAKTVVCPGLKCFSHSVLTAGSIATKNMEAYSIYTGNPAIKVKDRQIKE